LFRHDQPILGTDLAIYAPFPELRRASLFAGHFGKVLE
jgi:hypothetical protein